MNNFRNKLNSNERTARAIVGVDTNADFTTNTAAADNLAKIEKINTFNDSVDKMESKLAEHMKMIEEQSEALARDLQGVDIMPVSNYVLVKPFEHNPFQKIKMDASGVYLDTGGLTPEYKSEEDGTIHEEVEMIKAGIVLETGYKCEFLQQGDIIFYNDYASSVQVPFYKLGLVVVNEQRVITVIGDNLSERKNKMINGK